MRMHNLKDLDKVITTLVILLPRMPAPYDADVSSSIDLLKKIKQDETGTPKEPGIKTMDDLEKENSDGFKND